MSDKMICPGCEAYTSGVLIAHRDGQPCPYCGLSLESATEITRIQQTRADDELKAQLAEAIKARETAERKAAKLEQQLARVRQALDD